MLTKSTSLSQGGSLENRSRIHFEIIDAIREKVPDPKFILSIKINSQDFIDGGLSEEESQTMCKQMEEKGMSLIELSGGTASLFPSALLP